MDPKQIAKQLLDVNKIIFDNTFKTMTILREQIERMEFYFLEKTPWIPEDSKKLIDEWFRTWDENSEKLKSYADENYERTISYFTGSEKEGEKESDGK